MEITESQNLLKNKRVMALIAIGALSLFFGTANPIVHIPFIVLGYPAALFLLANEAHTTKKALLYGWLTGAIGTALGMYWLVVPVNVYGHFPLILSIPVPLLMGVVNGIIAALFTVIMNKAKNIPHIWQVLFTFFAWYFCEWVRSWIFTGFTWMNLSSAMVAWPVLIQGASVLGMEGLSAVYAFIGVAFISKKRAIQAFAMFVLIGIVGLGFARMQGDLAEDNVDYAHYLLVQGNISQELKWAPDMQASTLEKYLSLSANAIKNSEEDIDFIVFPETALPFYLQNERAFHADLKRFTQAYQIPIITGGATYRREQGEINLYNSAFLIEPLTPNAPISYNLGQVYSKQHLLPFGEYIPPFLDFKLFHFIFDGIGAFTPGVNQEPLHYDGHKLGVLICYEGIFSYLAQESVEKGAQLLVNISNDAWYGESSAAKQHLDLSILRAVEQNRYMVRSTNTGITAFINPYGEITSSTGLFVDATLVDKVGYRDVKSLYYYLAPYLPYVFNLIFLMFVCMLCIKSGAIKRK